MGRKARKKRRKTLMRKLGIIAVLSLMALALAAVPALAQTSGVHFLRGPFFTDEGTTLRATGTLAGLGGEDVTVTLTATGTGSVTCTNPAGKVAPGQSFTTSVTGTQSDIEVKNGRANFDVETLAPTAPAGSCPNPKWTATVTDVAFTSATITATQDGIVVLAETFQL
jgi:hypothetical protein